VGCEQVFVTGGPGYEDDEGRLELPMVLVVLGAVLLALYGMG